MTNTNLISSENIASLENKEIVAMLMSNEEKGLTTEEAELRLKEFGENAINANKPQHLFLELLKQFKSPLILILIIATIISYSIGETVSASIIFFIILLSVGIDFYQEKDARNAAERLKESVKSKATVVRNGSEYEVLHEEICMGDIILLSAGKIVPADVRYYLPGIFL